MTTSQSQASALAIADTAGKMAITPAGIQINGELTFDEWRASVQSMSSIKDWWRNGLGDLIQYGRQKFGEDQVSAQLAQLEFEVEDTIRASAIGQLTLEFRQANQLSSEHYYILSSKLPDEDTRKKWAAHVIAHQLTPNELRRSIEAGKILRQDQINKSSGADSGIPTIQGTTFSFSRWLKQVGGIDKIKSWPDSHKQQLLTEITPIRELISTLEATTV